MFWPSSANRFGANYPADPALIGGIRARVASREYDASVEGQAGKHAAAYWSFRH